MALLIKDGIVKDAKNHRQEARLKELGYVPFQEVKTKKILAKKETQVKE